MHCFQGTKQRCRVFLEHWQTDCVADCVADGTQKRESRPVAAPHRICCSCIRSGAQFAITPWLICACSTGKSSTSPSCTRMTFLGSDVRRVPSQAPMQCTQGVEKAHESVRLAQRSRTQHQQPRTAPGERGIPVGAEPRRLRRQW
jgi:hypothetical protein